MKPDGYINLEEIAYFLNAFECVIQIRTDLSLLHSSPSISRIHNFLGWPAPHWNTGPCPGMEISQMASSRNTVLERYRNNTQIFHTRIE